MQKTENNSQRRNSVKGVDGNFNSGYNERKKSNSKKTSYNEYQTNAMIWARSTNTVPGDLNVLNSNGKYFALIEATENGFIELKKGKYKEVQTEYERAYRKANNEIYGNLEGYEADRGTDSWDMQFYGEGRDGNRDTQQIESKEFRSDTARNDEYLRGSNQRESVKDTGRRNSVKMEDDSEEKRITDTARWYKGRINGEALFAIYSTEDVDNPTILYERKGIEAKEELDVLLEYLEEIENGKSIVDVSKDINTLLSGDWVRAKHNLANNNDRLRERGSDTGYASVLQGESSEFIGSQAFRNVVKNLFDIQSRKGVNSKDCKS